MRLSLKFFVILLKKYEIEIVWGGNNIVVPQTLPKGIEQSFAKRHQGDVWWWQPTEPKTEKHPDFSKNVLADFDSSKKHEYVQVNIDNVLNASVTDIFHNKYLSPRSPYTTMQTPVQGVGEWCHPKLIYAIDDTGFRGAVKNETFETPLGIPFRVPIGSNNIAFTTLWDNYPDSITVPLSGKARYACLLMAGTTNPMQYGVTNGTVTVLYSDGTKSELELRNPETWCPIELDYYTDDLAFKMGAMRPYRVSFKTGIVSRDMEADMNIEPKEVYAREIDGGAGIILGIQLDNSKELKSMQWKSIANEVVIGMLSVTLMK